MKEYLDRIVKCKKCGHGAHLYHDRGGGCIKSCKGASAVPFTGRPDSTPFLWWVVAVCKRKECKNLDKPVPLSENEFRDLMPPPCPVCKQIMKPDRDGNGKGDYIYRCENNNCKSLPLAGLLPVLE